MNQRATQSLISDREAKIIELPLNNFQTAKDRAIKKGCLMQFVEEVKTLLRDGIDSDRITPFSFHFKNKHFTAHDSGLAAFVWAEKEWRDHEGATATRTLFRDYLNYTETIFKDYSWCAEMLREVEVAKENLNNPPKNYDYAMACERFLWKLKSFVGELNEFVLDNSPNRSQMGRTTYQVHIPTFNSQDYRKVLADHYGITSDVSVPVGQFLKDFGELEIQYLKHLGIKAFWPLGVFPIGKLYAKGDGSPYSLVSHSRIDEERIGTMEDWQRLKKKLQGQDVSLVVDFVPNHTSWDSDLIKECPEAFIHIGHKDSHHPRSRTITDKNGVEHNIAMAGFREGNGHYQAWEDAAQLDITHPKTFEYHMVALRFIIKDLGADIVRTDAVEHLLGCDYGPSWSDYCYDRSKIDGYLTKLLTAIKREFPDVLFVGEAYVHRRELASIFDVLYNKADIKEGRSHHTGFYDALVRRDRNKILSAVTDIVCIQKTGNGTWCYFSDHDTKDPVNVFHGNYFYAAQFLTAWLPENSVILGGIEFGASNPDNDHNDEKVISFKDNKPLSYCPTANQDIYRLTRERLAFANRYKINNPDMKLTDLRVAVHMSGCDSLVAYMLRSKIDINKQVLILANISEQPIHNVKLFDKDLGLNYTIDYLAPVGPDGCDVVCLHHD